MSDRADVRLEIEILGDTALLLRLGERIDAALNARVHAVAHALREARLPGVREIVPAYASIAVHYDALAWFDAADALPPHACIAARLLEFAADQKQEHPSAPTLSLNDETVAREREDIVEIPVCYGGEHGPDLHEVAQLAQLADADVIALHTAREYRVAMLGFAPGFPYLLGLDTRLHTPRRASPRTRVPAGAVAIGGAQTGIYPRELPGGWHLIGRTPLALFDAQRDPPALLAPGQRVRFRISAFDSTSAFVPECGNQKAAVPGRTLQQSSHPRKQGVGIKILSPGLLTTVQDGGRGGHAAIGVGAAGAMDAVALRLANILVGNAPDAAALEITLRGPRLAFAHDTLVALGGAEIDARCGDAAVPMWRPLLLRAGSELAFGGMRRGARAYLAVAGGIDLPRVLGSRSTDVNAALGPVARPLAAGDVLPCAPTPRDLCGALWGLLEAHPRSDCSESRSVVAANWSLDPAPWFDASVARLIHLVPGTHFEQLDAESQRALFEREFRIGVDSNRVGLRLEGVPLQLAQAFESISAGVVPGTLQLPPGGTPIALAAEAPTTGGYPRIGHVIAVDQSLLAQRRPGDSVRFARCDLAEAQIRYLERERALASLARNISERLRT